MTTAETQPMKEQGMTTACNEVWTCHECGSMDVETTVWWNPNENTYGDVADTKGYCHACNDEAYLDVNCRTCADEEQNS